MPKALKAVSCGSCWLTILLLSRSIFKELVFAFSVRRSILFDFLIKVRIWQNVNTAETGKNALNDD
jgi:hypothetical protein